MKLLFDQNISFRIIKKLDDYFPGSKHVSQVGLMNSQDNEIWGFAKLEELTIVTFDADFFDISLINGHPPKIIWIRSGNISTDSIARLFINRREAIQDFIGGVDLRELSCLEIE